MKKILFFIFLIGATIGFSQENEEYNFWNNVRFGGGLGLGFGNNTTTFAISPTAIYDFNEKVSLGVSVGYQYSKQNDFKSNVYNIGILSLYNPFEGIQLSLEFDQLFINQRFGLDTYSYTVPSLNVGAAYRVSRNVSFGVRYDVLYDETKSVFASPISPIVRIFF